MSDNLRAALALLDIDPRIADHLVKIRDDVEAAYRGEIDSLRTSLTAATSTIAELTARAVERG